MVRALKRSFKLKDRAVSGIRAESYVKWRNVDPLARPILAGMEKRTVGRVCGGAARAGVP